MPRTAERGRHALRVVLVAASLAAVAACGRRHAPAVAAWSPEVSEDLTTRAVADVGLAAPSAVLYDGRGDVYLVSNAPRDASDGAGGGFISRVSPRGEVETLRWIDGATPGVTLRAPRGMAIRGDTLYVADTDCVRLFRRGDGAPSGSICPEGAAHLQAMTVDEAGVVYVTDRGADASDGAIYAIPPSGAPHLVLRGAELGTPNGIAASVRGVFAVGLDSGGVYQLTPDGPRTVAANANWHLGGIVFTKDGSFLFSNQADSTVLYVRAKQGGARGEVFTLARRVPGPGDLGYDARRDRVIVPVPSLNSLFFVDLAP